MQEAFTTQDKGVSVTIDFKRVTFDLDDSQFKNLIEEAANAAKQRLMTAYEARKSTKSVLIGGVDPLQTKGVSIGVSFDF